VGTKKLRKGGTLGFNTSGEMEDYDAVKTKVLGAMKQLFNPEFINRIDETIVFKALDRADIEQIVEIMLARVNSRLVNKHITITLTPEGKEFLVDKGYDSEYGARPMRRAIQRYLEDPLSQLIIEGSVPEGEVTVDFDPKKDELVFSGIRELAKAAPDPN
jgi:ATP-dependent Clp protease ATP-binding subunit ClpC